MQRSSKRVHRRQTYFAADDWLELSLSIWENEGGALHSRWILAREPRAQFSDSQAPDRKLDQRAGKALKA